MIEHDVADVCVVGLGASGGTIAAALATAGLQVVGLEAGPDHDPARSATEFDADEIAAIVDRRYMWSEPEVLVYDGGAPMVFNWLPRNIGVGGPLHWSGFSYRYHPSDFRIASEQGVPADSSVADWPVSYNELEPFYEEAEQLLNVAGAWQQHPYDPPRRADYPMPPVPSTGRAEMLADAARAIGWHPYRQPAAVRTVPGTEPHVHDCNGCGHCTFFACGRNAKGSTLVSVLPPARATGNLDVRAECLATEVTVDSGGRPNGVRYRDARGDAHEQPAHTIVLALNAPYVARLLLLSTSPHHRRGLGNVADQVGRHATFHTSTMAYGVFDDVMLHAERGPQVQVGVDDFNEHRPWDAGAPFRRGGVLNAGMPAAFAGGPLSFATALGDWVPLPDGVPPYGDEYLRFAAHAYPRHVAVFGLGEDLPRPENRVTLDPDVVDSAGLPAIRITFTPHDEDRASAQYLLERSMEWLDAAGADVVLGAVPPLPGGIRAGHAHGTTRMGTSPDTSVADSVGLVHGFDNLFVAGAGLFVTSAGYNPCLTIVALALRAAGAIAEIAANNSARTGTFTERLVS